MRITLLFFVSIVIATLVPNPASAAPLRIAKSVRAQPSFVHSRPQVVENGSDLALFNFTGNIAHPVAFAPDGSSYALVRDGLLKISPNGSQTFVLDEDPATRNLLNRTYAFGVNRYQSIVYADGYLWFHTFRGIIRLRPDGTQNRFYQFGIERNGFDEANNLVAGADGIYFTAFAPSFQPPYGSYVIARLGFADFKLTVFTMPAGYAEASLVATPDGHFDYLATAYVGSLTSLFQIQPDGTSRILGTTPDCTPTRNAVVSLGAIYYVGSHEASNSDVTSYALCRATLSGKIGPITATVVGQGSSGQIAADNSADLWTIDLFGNGLYSYNIVSKKLVGAYEPSVLNALMPYWLYVGPDQNVWFFGDYALNQVFYGAYVRHQQVFTPTSISLNSETPSGKFLVAESIKSAPWTAVSLNPAVATVTPASSLSGRFYVTHSGIGSTAIAVTDAYGNVSYETVSSN